MLSFWEGRPDIPLSARQRSSRDPGLVRVIRRIPLESLIPRERESESVSRAALPTLLCAESAEEGRRKAAAFAMHACGVTVLLPFFPSFAPRLTRPRVAAARSPLSRPSVLVFTYIYPYRPKNTCVCNVQRYGASVSHMCEGSC